MGSYKEVDGDLIDLALKETFNVIVHGCNCLCNMGAGVAVPMKNAFACDKFPLEHPSYRGDMNKLGQIDYVAYTRDGGSGKWFPIKPGWAKPTDMYVVNAYTQYRYGRNHADGDAKPFDYEAFTLCMRKMNHVFKGKHIGMPKIGSHLAGGDWQIIKGIVQKELKDCDVTVVNYVPTKDS